MNSAAPQIILPAENMRGVRFAQDFENSLEMAKDRWTLYGSPTVRNGITLDGSSQYATRPVTDPGMLNNSGTFMLEVDYQHVTDALISNSVFLEATGAGNTPWLRFEIDGFFSLQVWWRTYNIITVNVGDWSSYFVNGGRNVFTFTHTMDGAAVAWLNGTQLTNSSSSTGGNATVTPTTDLFLGRRSYASQDFLEGTVNRFRIGLYTPTTQEHQDVYNNVTWNWENTLTTNLQFRFQDYDPTNVRTLDSSGNGNHFTLGDGATSTTYPTQSNGRMTFDGGDYLARPSVAQPSGSFSVCVTVSSTLNGAAEYVASHGLLGTPTNFLLANLGGVWSFYVGGTGGGNRSFMAVANTSSNLLTFVGTWDGTNTILYVNGVAEAPAVAPMAPGVGTATMELGRRNSVASNYLTGAIYDFKYVDGIALTPTQAADYHQKILARIGSEV